jgi:protein-L-isoaspartate(D-aspartate) O-methyltransferase
MNAAPGPEHFVAAAEFVLMLRQSGFSDRRVLRAMEQVPRVPFLDPRFFHLADEDIALPIALGQTILKPTLVAAMLEALAVEPHHRVLQVGTGSGYTAAVLGRLAAGVITIERWRRLADEAHVRLRRLGYEMVETQFGDGLGGYPPRAPYDRILLTCAVDDVPEAIPVQLAPAGVLIAALANGEIIRLKRESGAFSRTVVTQGQVDPAVPGVARRL